MNNLIYKARSGRTNALTQRQGLLGGEKSVDLQAVRFKTSRRIDPIAFISSRTQIQANAWIH